MGRFKKRDNSTYKQLKEKYEQAKKTVTISSRKQCVALRVLMSRRRVDGRAEIARQAGCADDDLESQRAYLEELYGLEFKLTRSPLAEERYNALYGTVCKLQAKVATRLKGVKGPEARVVRRAFLASQVSSLPRELMYKNGMQFSPSTFTNITAELEAGGGGEDGPPKTNAAALRLWAQSDCAFSETKTRQRCSALVLSARSSVPR